MSILKVRNKETGQWVDIPAIVGPKGDKGEQGVQGPVGATGPAGFPTIVNLSGATQSLSLESNVEYRCSAALTSLTITGFGGGVSGTSNAWCIQFIAGEGITVMLPDTVVWNYGATPVFTAGSEYTLAFTPMLSGKILGVWNEVEA